MKITSNRLGIAGACALALLGAQPAFAAGTTAGSTITNNVTVNYQVGSVAQTASTASNAFTVDRRINVTVADANGTTTTVSPGQLAAVTTFTVTNLSNAPLDFALTVAQQAGGAGAHANTDTFDATNVRIYADTNTNGSYDAGTDTLITYLDEIAADAIRTVFVVVDIPLGETTTEVAAVTLTATGREAGTGGTLGAVLTQTAGANTATMDTVFGDGAGATDAARDAAFSAKDDYTVQAAALTVVKYSTLISDPLNGTTNPKAIPGATIEYCIAVSNATGSATATSVAITDPVPATMTFTAGTITLNGTVTSGVCNADGAAGGAFASGTVSGTIASLAAGETRTLRFRAVIN